MKIIIAHKKLQGIHFFVIWIWRPSIKFNIKFTFQEPWSLKESTTLRAQASLIVSRFQVVNAVRNAWCLCFTCIHYSWTIFLVSLTKSLCLAVKRLMREACELRDATDQYWAHPLEDNLFEWHFTVRGPPGTDFDGGVYHGRIILPPEYPMKPPNIILLTVRMKLSLDL